MIHVCDIWLNVFGCSWWLIESFLDGIKRALFAEALKTGTVFFCQGDFIHSYRQSMYADDDSGESSE